MTRKYTAADFANARFAEHEDGQIAMRCADPDVEDAWEVWTHTGYLLARSDAHMVFAGWVPVPTKPVLTESEIKKMVGNYEVDDFAAGFAGGFRYAGGEVIPDPEPTNTDRLEQLIRESGARIDANGIAKYLNNHGVTAPKEDK